MKMTDKEKIIIDGVDVSECAYFDYENEGTKECYAYSNECEANNCYFKQLARKTQECEELEKTNKLLLVKAQDGISKRAWAYEQCKKRADRYRNALEEIENYINSQGIDNKWNMYIQRFRSGILNIINKAKDSNNGR